MEVGGIGKMVRAARKRAGLSQEALARRADMSTSAVTQIELGTRNDPQYSSLLKLSTALGLTVSDLLEETSPLASAPSASPSPEAAEAGQHGEEVSEEERREEDEFSVSERCYLIPLMDGYTTSWSKRIADYGPAIATLPEDLTPADSFAAYQWVARFIRDCEHDELAVEKAGVMEVVVDGVLRRAQEKGDVPADILQKAHAFQEAWHELFVTVELAALRWVESQSKRPDVVAFPNKEKAGADIRAARAPGVLDIADFEHRRPAAQQRVEQRRQRGEFRGGRFAANEADVS
jgi:transcriptional regulator with XRE-family HTH domain